MKIDKNIPIPTAQSHSKYPFMDMDIGDSFSVPDGKLQDVRNAAHMSGKRKGLKFTIRKTNEGYRCWRIA